MELKIRFCRAMRPSSANCRVVIKSLPAQPMHWMRQLQFRYLENEKEGKKQALCMSIYLVKDVLYIRQIQGIAGTAPQRSFAIGQTIFIEFAERLRDKQRFEEVRLPKAETLDSYRNPHVNLQLTQNAQERTRERIKQSMELLYNANAEQLGFMSDGGWFKWQVPSRHAS